MKKCETVQVNLIKKYSITLTRKKHYKLKLVTLPTFPFKNSIYLTKKQCVTIIITRLCITIF